MCSTLLMPADNFSQCARTRISATPLNPALYFHMTHLKFRMVLLCLIQQRHQQPNQVKCENFCLLSSSLSCFSSSPAHTYVYLHHRAGRWKEMSIYHLSFLPQHYAQVVPPRTDPWNMLLDRQSDATTELCHYNTCATYTACSKMSEHA